jgi:hypothetical protein
VSEDDVHAVHTNASLEQKGAGVAISLDNQGQGTQVLWNFRGVVPFARLVVDEHRPWGRQSGLVGEGLIGEEQTILVPDIERLQAETARAVPRRDFDMSRMPVLRGSQRVPDSGCHRERDAVDTVERHGSAPKKESPTYDREGGRASRILR